MSEENKIQIFEDKKIRTAWNESEEEWYFSIVDVISVLTDSNEPRRYWSDLKRKLKAEGANQLYENIVQLKLQTINGNAIETVSAREMYDTLGLDKSNWSRWTKKNILNSPFAVENNDCVGFVTMTNGNETTL